MRKRIEIKEELFKPLYEQGCNDNEIARRFGVTAGTIMRFRHNLGLPVVDTSTKIDEKVFKKLSQADSMIVKLPKKWVLGLLIFGGSGTNLVCRHYIQTHR
jgi:hypothetical protein